MGKVTCLSPFDLETTKAALKLPSKKMKTKKAGIFPELEHLEKLAAHLQSAPLAFVYLHKKSFSAADDINVLLDKIEKHGRLSGPYFLCRSTEIREAASVIKQVSRR